MSPLLKVGRRRGVGHIPNAGAENISRIETLLRQVGGPNVVWGAKDVLDVWLVETRMEADRRAAQRLARATWALAVITLVLAAATVGLIVATVKK